MNDEIRVFLTLKYGNLITTDAETWKYFEIYPQPVLKKWIGRCNDSIEPIALKHQLTANLVNACKTYRGYTSYGDLTDCWVATNQVHYMSNQIYFAGECFYHSTRDVVDGEYLFYLSQVGEDNQLPEFYIDWLNEELLNWSNN